MGAVCKGQSSAFVIGSAAYPVKILLLGFSGVGKTVLLNSWLSGEESSASPSKPTQHFNVGLVSSPSRMVFMVYDLAGNIGCRLRLFLDGTEGVVFVLSSSTDTREEEMQWIHQLALERDLSKALFLFVFQTLDPDIEDKLQVQFEGRPWSAVQIPSLSQQSAGLVLAKLESMFRQHSRPL